MIRNVVPHEGATPVIVAGIIIDPDVGFLVDADLLIVGRVRIVA